MMREKFIEQLQTLYRQMTVMGGLCQQAIAVAVKTLEEEEETAEKLEAQVFALDGKWTTWSGRSRPSAPSSCSSSSPWPPTCGASPPP
ncbi:MAG: hypothetical protein ACLUNZ_07520 [Evtepia sp.]